MAKPSRIRWNDEETQAVVAAAKALAGKGDKLTGTQRFLKAQSGLPRNRRRPVNANASSWLTKAVKGEVAPVKANVKAPASSARTVASTVVPSIVTQALVDAGVMIVKGILSDPGVQKALRQSLGRK